VSRGVARAVRVPTRFVEWVAFERSSNRYDIGNAWTDPSLDGARLTLGGWRAWNAARAGRALVGALDASAASDASGGAPWPLETVPGRQ
jgi:hypothetical protein